MRMIGKRSLSSFLGVVLNLGWYVAGVGLALSLVLLLVSPWVDPPRVEVGLKLPVALQLDPVTHRATAAASSAENVSIEDVNGSIKFSPRSRTVVASVAVFLIVTLALVMWVVRQMRDVFWTLRDGTPFVAANAARISRIGWAVIIGELVGPVVNYEASRYAMTNFAAEGLRFHTLLDLRLLGIIYGLIILVIAEVFRAGARLDEEQSLTV